MKDFADGGMEPRVSFSEMREGARKRGETEWVGRWSEGLCLDVLHRDRFH